MENEPKVGVEPPRVFPEARFNNRDLLVRFLAAYWKPLLNWHYKKRGNPASDR